MNILYLHGLESKLSDEKRAILESYGSVIALDIDYKSDPDIIQNLYDEYKNQEINVIIGSSMGGFAGFHLANALGVCALLYNPALPYRNSVVQNIPSALPTKHSPLLRIVLGAQDEVIKAKDNLVFLAQNCGDLKDCSIEIINQLAHPIPVHIFEEQTEAFFDRLCY
jgi:predicted esterase YcpF (UPF0227 family)